MICPKCGNENPGSGKFCDHCGASLEQTKACSKCGAENPQTSKFCDHCGADLDQANVCPKCGAGYSKSAKFCGRCGTPLEAGGQVKIHTIKRKLEVPGDISEAQTVGVKLRENTERPKSIKWTTGLVAASGVANLILGALIAPIVPWLGTISIVIGALGFAVAYFIWRMKKWAAITAIVVSVVSIVGSVLNFDTLSIFGIIFQALVIALLIMSWRSYE